MLKQNKRPQTPINAKQLAVKERKSHNIANQFKPDPRQVLFLSYYFDPNSESFSNGLQSAIRAGYGKEYAENLVSNMPKWLSEFVGDQYLVKKAEKNIKEFLEMNVTNQGVTKDGKEIYEYDDAGKIRVKADVSKFILERLNKDKYSQRQEIATPLNLIQGIKIEIVLPKNDSQPKIDNNLPKESGGVSEQKPPDNSK
jgi:hypothetical protein